MRRCVVCKEQRAHSIYTDMRLKMAAKVVCNERGGGDGNSEKRRSTTNSWIVATSPQYNVNLFD